MRKLFIKARDYLDDGLRGMCGRLTPGKRVAAIVGVRRSQFLYALPGGL